MPESSVQAVPPHSLWGGGPFRSHATETCRTPLTVLALSVLDFVSRVFVSTDWQIRVALAQPVSGNYETLVKQKTLAEPVPPLVMSFLDRAQPGP